MKLGEKKRPTSPTGAPALTVTWISVDFQVAFLRLDRRGSGRLGAQELRMGLLIGAAVRIFRRIFMEVS